MSDTTDIEKKSLEAHVELCAERYRTLELKISNVGSDVAELKTSIQEMHDMLHNMTEKYTSRLIAWGAGIICSLLGVIGYFVTTFIIK